MSIINEQYTISNPSRSQIKEKSEELTKQELSLDTTRIDPILAQISDLNQREKVVEFSKFSNLTIKWSKE